MSHELTQDLEDLRRTVRGFAARRRRAGHRRALRAARVPVRRWSARWAEMGLFGLPFPEEYGGMGGDYFALCAGDRGAGPGRLSRWRSRWRPASGLGAMPDLPSSAPRSRSSSGCRGCAAARCSARSGSPSPAAGSDAGATRTTARLDGDEWVINGTQAVHHELRHRHHRVRHGHRRHRETADGEQGDLRDPRAQRHPRVHRRAAVLQGRLELPPTPTRSRFDDVRVPAENLLGERGRGYAQFLQILDEGRIAIAALATGLAQGCVDECGARTPRQRAGVRPPDRATTRRSQFKIADMEVARPHRPAAWLRRGRPAWSPGSRSSGRRRSPSCTPRRPRWTTPATPPRSTAATAS